MPFYSFSLQFFFVFTLNTFEMMLSSTMWLIRELWMKKYESVRWYVCLCVLEDRHACESACFCGRMPTRRGYNVGKNIVESTERSNTVECYVDTWASHFSWCWLPGEQNPFFFCTFPIHASRRESHTRSCVRGPWWLCNLPFGVDLIVALIAWTKVLENFFLFNCDWVFRRKWQQHKHSTSRSRWTLEGWERMASELCMRHKVDSHEWHVDFGAKVKVKGWLDSSGHTDTTLREMNTSDCCVLCFVSIKLFNSNEWCWKPSSLPCHGQSVFARYFPHKPQFQLIRCDVHTQRNFHFSLYPCCDTRPRRGGVKPPMPHKHRKHIDYGPGLGWINPAFLQPTPRTI